VAKLYTDIAVSKTKGGFSTLTNKRRIFNSYLPRNATAISHKPPVKKISTQSRQVILLKKLLDSLEEEDEEEDEEEEEEPPATLITLPPELARLASSAARKTTSKISPQCLHFLASFFTSSEQYGQI
jgi:hypothetical protein